MKIKTHEFYEVINIVNTFSILSKFFQNEYKRFLRLCSFGDGKLYIIVNNNEDMKLIQTINIETEYIIDKIYDINDIYTFVKNILNYTDFLFDVDNDKIIFEDGEFSLINIPLSKDLIEDIFNIDRKPTNNNFVVDDVMTKEIKDIFSILGLKSNYANSFFYRDSNLFFNFRDLYIKKKSSLSFVVTDICSLRMISELLLINKDKEIKYGTNDNRLVFDSENFYLETYVYIEDERTKNYLSSYFEDKQILKEVDIKFEFSNFINAIYSIDKESTIVFKYDKVLINSAERKNIGQFTIENTDEYFSINTNILGKILNYYIKNSQEKSLNLKIVECKNDRYLYFKTKDGVEILTIIGA